MFLLAAKKKVIRNLTILTLGITALTVLFFQLFFPERYFVCYPFIPLYFYLSGIIYINVSLFVYRHDDNKLLSVTLICRGVKFFLSLIAIAICGVLAREQVMAFGLTFIIYYLVFLVFETCFFFHMEMKLNNK